MEEHLRVGLVGAGVFASYHAGKISASEIADFVGVFDPNAAQAGALAAKCETRTFSQLDTLVSACDAVIVAAPATTHFKLAHEILKGGRHALIEKPLALIGEDARVLVELARASDLVLQTGHQERLVCAALGLFDIKERPKSINVKRKGPPPQNGRTMDVSVIWDLMIHDIDLVQKFLGSNTSQLTCQGLCTLGSELDQARAAFEIDQTAIRLEASRIAKTRARIMHLVYDSGEIELDFLARTVRNTSLHTLTSDLATLVQDPLGEADEMFFRACRFGEAPLITGQEAANAVATAEALERLALA